MQAPLLRVEDLHVLFSGSGSHVHAVRGVSLELSPGECLGIVGESGSGKSQLFLAVMGLLADTASTRGQVIFEGQALLGLNSKRLNAFRGNRLSMIFQDPLTSLTPHMTVEQQLSEVLRKHCGISGRQARDLCRHWLNKVRIPDADQRLGQYPHELSGGMRQRIMIATAMLCEPSVLIADEPTTALDATIQAEILDLIMELQQAHKMAVVVITHDMGVVARLCTRVNVMKDGQFVEEGSCRDVFHQPVHPYTRMLLNAVPGIPISAGDARADTVTSTVHRSVENRIAQQGAVAETANASAQSTADLSSITEPVRAEPLLEVEHLTVDFSKSSGWFRSPERFRAVNRVRFTLNRGEALGIVGESGSGKSTLARAILELIPSAGTVRWKGEPLALDHHPGQTISRRERQIVFQDPLASLDPSMTIGQSIAEPLRVHEPMLTGSQSAQRVIGMMQQVGLSPALVSRYPHELSGGQNQRAGIARAMIIQPAMLVCDEAVSALDVSIQAQIIELIRKLQKETGMALLFISHDLAVVHELSQRILVLYRGSIVEYAPRDSLFLRPQHPYTRVLISSVLLPDPDVERHRQRWCLPPPVALPAGASSLLRFLPDKLAQRDFQYQPELIEVFPGHFVSEFDRSVKLLVNH